MATKTEIEAAAILLYGFSPTWEEFDRLTWHELPDKRRAVFQARAQLILEAAERVRAAVPEKGAGDEG